MAIFWTCPNPLRETCVLGWVLGWGGERRVGYRFRVARWFGPAHGGMIHGLKSWVAAQLRPAWGFSPTCVAFAARTKGNLAPDPEASLNCGRRTPCARRRGAGCGSGDQAPSRAHGVLPCGWSSAPGSPPVILPPVPLKVSSPNHLPSRLWVSS